MRIKYPLSDEFWSQTSTCHILNPLHSLYMCVTKKYNVKTLEPGCATTSTTTLSNCKRLNILSCVMQFNNWNITTFSHMAKSSQDIEKNISLYQTEAMTICLHWKKRINIIPLIKEKWKQQDTMLSNSSQKPTKYKQTQLAMENQCI